MLRSSWQWINRRAWIGHTIVAAAAILLLTAYQNRSLSVDMSRLSGFKPGSSTSSTPPDQSVGQAASNLWHSGDRAKAIEILQAVVLFPANPAEFASASRQLGQYLLWNNEPEEAHKHFEDVLETARGMDQLDRGIANEAYSAAIQLAGPLIRKDRGADALMYVDFLLEHDDMLSLNSVSELMLHKIRILSHLDRTSDIAAMLTSDPDTLVAGPPYLQAAAALIVLEAQNKSPKSFDSSNLLQRVWREAPDRSHPQIASIGVHWVEQLATTGRRAEAQHAAIEVVRALIESREHRSSLTTEEQRRVQGSETSLLSFLQTADTDGLPEYALEANTIISQTTPAGSPANTTALNEIERLVDLISRADRSND
jgi:tetratricopeptide (TPR) repeat protein